MTSSENCKSFASREKYQYNIFALCENKPIKKFCFTCDQSIQ